MLPVLAFSNPGSRQSKLLILFCPADSREGYFEGLAELTRDGRQPTHEELVELMRKFDNTWSLVLARLKALLPPAMVMVGGSLLPSPSHFGDVDDRLALPRPG